ncbi:hypothetical protein [Longimicrobium sp.]|uniref:hypothetical protein n=1 Tax=Longimicrobium sp. TaxID=2029185 RepID=UPI002CF0E1AA|nr:hypothetical protein [Longimicrobium sp.]HSU16069.1 hypothetical protein [Longimicrobium sp.]
MPPRTLFVILVALAAAIALARWLAARRGRPKRVHHDDPLQQIDADFPPEHRAEAKALIESIAAHAKPDDRAIIWRRTVDAARGDIGKLRRSTPRAIAALDRIYRLLGDGHSTET